MIEPNVQKDMGMASTAHALACDEEISNVDHMWNAKPRQDHGADPLNVQERKVLHEMVDRACRTDNWSDARTRKFVILTALSKESTRGRYGSCFPIQVQDGKARMVPASLSD